MGEFLQMIVLGIVQGLAEFLPVSSSGHLILLQNIFGITEGVVFNSIMLHLGTLVAVCIYYFKDILGLFKRDGWSKLGLIVIATIPAAVLGFLLNDKMEELFGDGKYLCFFFLATAAMLVVTEIFGKKIKSSKPVGIKSACIMGAAQCVGLFPGISRSGSTICGGILSKAEPNDTAKFSFLMSLPVIAGAALVDIIGGVKDGNLMEGVSVFPLLAGIITAGVVGYLAIAFMVKLVGKCNFKWFSVYLVAISVVTFIDSFIVSIW